MAELKAQLLQGNHQGAKQQLKGLQEEIVFDVEHGFAVPIHKAVVPDIKDEMVQPCNLADHFFLSNSGEKIKKKRLTHDLSFWITKLNASINKRTDSSLYPELIYGFCLSQIIHYVCALRSAYPNEQILISKFDFSDAYRQVAHSLKAAAQTILVIEEIAYICLRLSYGGAPNPSTFCSFLEMVTNLSNKIPLISG